MRIASFRTAGVTRVGLVTDRGLVDVSARTGVGSVRALLQRDPGLQALRALPVGAVDFRHDEVQWEPVIPDPGKILCVGINYLTHVRETGREVPKYPMLFTRFSDSQVGHGGALLRPRASERLDYEGELAVVIGRTARAVPAAAAWDFVAGYSAYNDGSVRDFQRHTTQFIPGKNFPCTGGFGPWLVTPDEFGSPADAVLTTRVNGQERQRAPVSDLIFDVPSLIAYCSSFTTLHPGDVLVTGTPGGVGFLREPPEYLRPGDLVEVDITGIGTLRNGVADEALDGFRSIANVL